MASATHTVNTARVTSVTLGDYDQIFALTQYMINIGLKNKWIAAKKKRSQAEIAHPADEELPGLWSLAEAIIGYPRLVVKNEFVEGLAGVSYVMCFDGGNLKLQYDVFGDPTNPSSITGEDIQSFDIAGWRIAFRVQLGMDPVEHDSEEYREKMGETMSSDEYSLNALVARLNKAQVDIQRSQLTGTDWRSWPQGLMDKFTLFACHLLTHQEGDFRANITLGYARISLKHSEETQLNFEPHRIQYVTYPWINPDDPISIPVGSSGLSEHDLSPSYGLEGDARLNYLLYCATTGQRELPDNRILNWRGNFTDGRIKQNSSAESGDFGGFMMARQNFFEGYLLKKLQKLNKAFEPTIFNVSVKADGYLEPWYRWDCDLRFGDRRVDESDDFYKFKAQGRNSWLFESLCTPEDAQDMVGAGGWSAKLWGNAKCCSRTEVSFEPGTDIILIKGSSRIMFEMHWENYHHAPWRDDEKWIHHRSWDTTWTMKLNIEAVDDGGLQIVSKFGEIETKIDAQGIEGLQAYDQYTREAHEVAKANLSILEKSLAEDLAGHRGFVLPAEGIFYFKNPILGHDGDLICSLSYNDTPPKHLFDGRTKIKGVNARKKVIAEAGRVAPSAVTERVFQEN